MKKTRLFTMMILALLVLMAMPLASFAQDDVVTLRFWIASSSQAAEIAVETWNTNNPNIQVEVVAYSNNDQGQSQLDTALLAGEADIFVNYGIQRFVARQEAGLMLALDEYWDGLAVGADFGTTATVIDGQTWAIPAHIQPYFVYVNQTAFNEAGIEVPSEWTWDEFYEIAGQLTTGEGPTKTFAAMFPRWPYTNELAYYERGWDFNVNPEECTTNFDDSIWIDVINVRANAEVDLEVAIPYADIRAGDVRLANELYNNRISMAIGGTWVLSATLDQEGFPRDFMTSFAPMPSLDEDGYTYRPGKLEDWYAVASNSENPAEAVQFMEWFLTEGYEPMIADGRFSTWAGYTAEDQARLFLPEGVEEVMDVQAFQQVVLGDEREFSTPLVLIGNAEIETIFRDQAIRVLAGELTAEEAVAIMKEQADQTLAGLCE